MFTKHSLWQQMYLCIVLKRDVFILIECGYKVSCNKLSPIAVVKMKLSALVACTLTYTIDSKTESITMVYPENT